MNKTEFLSFIEHPENIGSASLTESEKVLSKFPYWQSARLIFVKALQQQQHFSFDSQLKLAAIYSGNRGKLFELINKSESGSSSSSSSSSIPEGHPERSRRSAEGDSSNGSSQFEVVNKTSESDLIAIEKTEEPFYSEVPTETPDENIIATENFLSENIEIVTTESNVEEATETPDENIIATENFLSENIEILTTESNIEEPTETSNENIIATESSISESPETLNDKKEEDFNENENDLSKIIEQRIKELTEQNSSYGIIKNQNLITENNFENELPSTDQNTLAEIENNVSDKNSLEDETVSIEEEMAAIEVYEETTIADDIFNSPAAEVTSTTEIIEEKVNESHDNVKTSSSQHSFLDWFKFLKKSESEDESSSSSGSDQVGHPERSRRSAEGDEGSSSSSGSTSIEIVESQIQVEENSIHESAAQIIVSEEPETLNTNAETSNDEQKISIEIEQETRNLKPETLNPPDSYRDETVNLIDKFIEEDPRIQPKKNAFFSPSVAARKSVEYDDEVVSETLAEIFYKQQVYDKALKAYEKLTLMFPEKSTLFAARIKKIKEESKSGK